MPDDRLPPQDLDAEQAALGACLLETAAMDLVAAYLDMKDFYREAHQVIFAAMLEVKSRDEPVDIVTVAAELRRRGKLESVGGGEYLTALIGQVPTAARAARYAKIVHEKALLRDLIRAGSEIQALAYQNPHEAVVAVDSALARIDSIQERCHVNGRSRMMGDLEAATEAFDRMERRRNRPYEISTVCFGIEALDRITGGLEDAGYCVLLGDTGEGKTSLLVQIVMQTCWQIQTELTRHDRIIEALRLGGDEASVKAEIKRREETHKKRILIVGMEEGQWRWHLRMASYAGGFDTRECRNMPTFEDAKARYDDLEKSYWKAFSDVVALPVRFAQDEQTISSIEAEAKRVNRESNLSLIVVDYLQKIGHPDRSLDRVQQLGNIAGRLRKLSERLGCPILATSQVTRNADGVPVTKDSKALMESADATIIIERKKDDNGDPLEQCRLRCGKAKESTRFKPFRCVSSFHTGRWSEDKTPEGERSPRKRRKPEHDRW